jgi:putative NADH-flavin reductase
MKIAVIGANGHTGRIVVRDALASGHEVIAIARTQRGLSLNPPSNCLESPGSAGLGT